MGDSRGKWEGDTLVVELRKLDERTWFDHAGNFHSEALHVVERYSPRRLVYRIDTYCVPRSL